MPPENKSVTSTSPTIGFHQLRQAWEISSLRETLARREQDVNRLQSLVEREVERVRKLFSALESHELTDATIITPILSEAVAALIDIRDASRHLDERFDDSLPPPGNEAAEARPHSSIPSLAPGMAVAIPDISPLPAPFFSPSGAASDLGLPTAASLLARASRPAEAPEEESGGTPMETVAPPMPRANLRTRAEPAQARPGAESNNGRPVSWLLQPVNPPMPQPTMAPSTPLTPIRPPRAAVPEATSRLNTRANPASSPPSIDWLRPVRR